MRILDLGCGTAKVEGAIGVDVIPLQGVDVVADLGTPPYPFANNLFDAIYLNDIIEHLPDTIATMEELYRLSRPDARVFIRVVNWNSHYTAMDPTHLKAFTENSFDFFGKRVGRSYYSRARFDVVRVVRGYNGLAKSYFHSERLMYFLSRFLNNVLEDLNFELRAVKDAASVKEPTETADLFKILRCPYCASSSQRNDPGRLNRVRDVWLVCQDCGRKYPVHQGLPILLRKEGDLWMDTAVEDLPASPPKFELTPIDSKPIESVAAPDAEPVPIISVKDLLVEVGRVYSMALVQMITRRTRGVVSIRRVKVAGVLFSVGIGLGLLIGRNKK